MLLEVSSAAKKQPSGGSVRGALCLCRDRPSPGGSDAGSHFDGQSFAAGRPERALHVPRRRISVRAPATPDRNDLIEGSRAAPYGSHRRVRQQCSCSNLRSAASVYRCGRSILLAGCRAHLNFRTRSRRSARDSGRVSEAAVCSVETSASHILQFNSDRTPRHSFGYTACRWRVLQPTGIGTRQAGA